MNTNLETLKSELLKVTAVDGAMQYTAYVYATSETKAKSAFDTMMEFRGFTKIDYFFLKIEKVDVDIRSE